MLKKLSRFNEFVEESVFRSTVMHSTGKVVKDEDKTEFDLYLDDVEWVDIGHPKYLFPKKPFEFTNENGFVYKKTNLKTIVRYIKNLKPGYKIITKPTVSNLISKYDFEFITHKDLSNNFDYYDYLRFYKPNSDEFIDLPVSGTSYCKNVFVESTPRKSSCTIGGDYYYVDIFKLTNSVISYLSGKDRIELKGKKNDYIKDEDDSQRNAKQFILYVVKEKIKK